jgi:RND family efflux transporter MFP subunit
MSSAQDQDARVKALGEAVRAADAEAGAADAETRAMGTNLDLLTIVAPIDGTIITRPLRPGELVGPGATPILEMADFTSLVVEVDVPEGRLGRVKPAGPCEIVLDAYPARRFRGQTIEILPRVNRAKATVAVKVKFSDPTDGDERVLPDMAARVSFLQKALDDKAIKDPPRLVVPTAAVVERDGSKVVFVVDRDNADRVRMMPILLGAPFAGGFELPPGSPLSAGSKLVSAPPPLLKDGSKIKERND